jgi:hypothetical protein
VGWLIVQIPAGRRDFFLLQNVQSGYGAHSASFSVGTGGLFQGVYPLLSQIIISSLLFYVNLLHVNDHTETVMKKLLNVSETYNT